MVKKVRLIQAGVVVILLAGLAWGAKSLYWSHEGPAPEAASEEKAPPNKPTPAPKQGPGKMDVEHSVSAEDLLTEKSGDAEKKAPEPKAAAECPVYCPPCPTEPAKPDPPKAEIVTVKTEEPPPRNWGNANAKLTRPLVVLLAREKQSFWGYLVNDLVVGKMLDNDRSRQTGELYTVKPVIAFLVEKTSPRGNEPSVALNENFIEADLTEYWFTSGETRIDRSIKALQAMGTGLDNRGIKLAASPANLREILNRATAVLDEQQSRLTGDTGVLDTDNVFYHAQGSAIALSEIIGGLNGCFGPAIEAAHIQADLKSAAGALTEGAAMDPWMVLGHKADFIGRDHLNKLASHLADARAALSKAQARLPAPEPEKERKK